MITIAAHEQQMEGLRNEVRRRGQDRRQGRGGGEDGRGENEGRGGPGREDAREVREHVAHLEEDVQRFRDTVDMLDGQKAQLERRLTRLGTDPLLQSNNILWVPVTYGQAVPGEISLILEEDVIYIALKDLGIVWQGSVDSLRVYYDEQVAAIRIQTQRPAQTYTATGETENLIECAQAMKVWITNSSTLSIPQRTRLSD